MYVCMCNPTTDQQILAVTAECSSPSDVAEKLDICKGCKSCSKEIEDIFFRSKA